LHLLVETVVIDPTYNAFEHFDSHIVKIEVSGSSLSVSVLFGALIWFKGEQTSVRFLYFAPAETHDCVIHHHRNRWSEIATVKGSLWSGSKVWFFPVVVLCMLRCLLIISCARRKTLKNNSELIVLQYMFQTGFVRDSACEVADWDRKFWNYLIICSDKGNIHLNAVVGDRNTVDTTVVQFK
jgi:hypothetical protein